MAHSSFQKLITFFRFLGCRTGLRGLRFWTSAQQRCGLKTSLATRHIHELAFVFWLRKEGSSPRFYGTWPCHITWTFVSRGSTEDRTFFRMRAFSPSDYNVVPVVFLVTVVPAAFRSSTNSIPFHEKDFTRSSRVQTKSKCPSFSEEWHQQLLSNILADGLCSIPSPCEDLSSGP